jgi:hypothetical protein
MTVPGSVPIAFTADGQPIFPAPAPALGQLAPWGLMADGLPIWPVAAGVVSPDQAQPIGVRPDGTYVFGTLVSEPTPATASDEASEPLGQTLAAPAGFMTAPSGAGPTSASGWGVSSGQVLGGGVNAPSNQSGDVRPLWKKKRFFLPAAGLSVLLVAGALSDPETTVVTEAGSVAQSQPPTQSAEQAAADAAAAEKAAAEKAAADKAAAERAAADKAAAEKAAAEKGPKDQQAVLAAVVAGREGYEDSDNELKQRQVQAQRSRALRAAVPTLKVVNWVGEIRSIDTNSEGKAVLELNIGDDTKVSTWNNALSDIGDDTLIPLDSPIYAVLVNLEEGAKIRFSGTFFRDDEQGLKETSLTFNGQMKTPNFLMRFSSIAPL